MIARSRQGVLLVMFASLMWASAAYGSGPSGALSSKPSSCPIATLEELSKECIPGLRKSTLQDVFEFGGELSDECKRQATPPLLRFVTVETSAEVLETASRYLSGLRALSPEAIQSWAESVIAHRDGSVRAVAEALLRESEDATVDASIGSCRPTPSGIWAGVDRFLEADCESTRPLLTGLLRLVSSSDDATLGLFAKRALWEKLDLCSELGLDTASKLEHEGDPELRLLAVSAAPGEFELSSIRESMQGGEDQPGRFLTPRCVADRLWSSRFRASEQWMGEGVEKLTRASLAHNDPVVRNHAALSLQFKSEYKGTWVCEVAGECSAHETDAGVKTLCDVVLQAYCH